MLLTCSLAEMSSGGFSQASAYVMGHHIYIHIYTYNFGVLAHISILCYELAPYLNAGYSSNQVECGEYST